MKTSAVLFDEADGPPKWWRKTYRSREQSVMPWITVEEWEDQNRKAVIDGKLDLWESLKNFKGESLVESWTRLAGTPTPEPVVVPVPEELIWPVNSAGGVLQLSDYINELHEMILDLREEVRELQGEL